MSAIRVILSTGSLWLADTAYTFELAAEAGYDGMEIMCDERFTTRSADYLQKLGTDFGLPILVLHSPFSGRLPGWGNSDTEQGRVEHTVRLAEQLGAERIVVHLPLRIGRGALTFGKHRIQFPWFSPVSDFKAWMASGGFAAFQASTDVQLAVENLPAKHFMGKPRDFTWWNSIEAWSRVHDHLTLDTTHWGTFGIDPIVPLRAAGERVKHIHLSNYEDRREHRLPQSGELDLAAFLRELATMAFSGTVSVELNPDALAFDSPKATRRKLRETLDFCRTHLG